MLNPHTITTLARHALAEDAPWGDVTSDNVLPPSARAAATLAAREAGVFSGGDVLRAVFAAVEPAIRCSVLVDDGAPIAAGQSLAEIVGPARAVLRGERVALNFVQRMTGIATLTRRYVDAVAGTRARIVDTRKTTPGLRELEKHAVRCGGGGNHRHSLSDAVMVKDNHLAVLSAEGIGVTEAIRMLRSRLSHTTHLEVEVDSLEQIDAVLAGGADTIMLDNFTLEDLRRGVTLIDGRALVEASGGVDLSTVAAIAATGVDLISVGALTHGARALDLGLDVTVSA